MNFSIGDDQQVLKDSAQVFLDEQISLKPLLTPGASVRDAGFAANWTKIALMGWPGLLIPEDYGGAGLSCLELVMIVEELGRTLTPSPFLGTLLGTLAVIKAGSEAQKSRVLPMVAAGEAAMAMAVAGFSGREDRLDPDTRADAAGPGWRIAGRKSFVIDAAEARFLVVAIDGAGDGARRLYLVDVEQGGVSTIIEPWRDITRQVCSVTFDGATAEPLAGDMGDAWPWVRDRALLALSAENAAGLRHVVDVTTGYARHRVAFGKPIGAYQAIKHSLADMLGAAEAARTATLYAAWALAEENGRGPLAAAMAKAFSGDAYLEATQRSIQIFGAIGFTWEMPNHLYLKRARGNSELFGSSRHHRSRVIDMVRAESA